MKSEEELKAGSERLHLAAQATGVGIWEWNVITNQIRWDDQMFRLYGLAPTPDGIVSYSAWSGAVLAEDLPRQEAILQDTVRRCGHSRREFRIRRVVDGEVREIQAVETVRTGPGGQAEWVVGTNLDVTGRRQMEEQLRQSQKMEAVGQLAGGIAHDFNNILAALIMEVDLLAMEKDYPPQQREGLAQIRNLAERAARLVRQLLQFGRREMMHQQDLDLNEVIASLVKMLQRVIPEDVEVKIQCHSGPLPIHADQGMIEQVLMNLALNARDAMPRGGILGIQTGEMTVNGNGARQDDAQPAPGRYATFTVSDTGPGIPPEVLPRIFEPFFTTKEVGKGTGMGLATAFGIVKEHRGWLQLDNHPGRGATFKVFLPFYVP